MSAHNETYTGRYTKTKENTVYRKAQGWALFHLLSEDSGVELRERALLERGCEKKKSRGKSWDSHVTTKQVSVWKLRTQEADRGQSRTAVQPWGQKGARTEGVKTPV